MAVLDHAHVKAEVIAGETAAKEYDGDDIAGDGPNTISKYIETQGGDFHFRVSLLPHFDWGEADTVVVRATVDGDRKTSDGLCLSRSHVNQSIGYTATLKGIWRGLGGQSELLHYRFSELATREQTVDDDVKTWKEKYGLIGTLKITFQREQLVSTREPAAKDDRITSDSSQVVPEKALKGKPIQLATAFRAVGGGQRPEIASTVKVDSEPLATIIFHYRSRRALQSLMIIERSPTPLPLEERDPETLTREELLELERRRRANDALKAEAKAVKRERSDSAPMPALKTMRGANGKTVFVLDSDTDDDDDDEVEEVQRVQDPNAGEIETVTLD